MQVITVFSKFADTDKPYYVSFETIIKRIRDGAVRAQIEQLRAESDPKEADRLKKLLPCICFSGRFIRRDDSSLTHHSGLIVLDFDNDPEKFREIPKSTHHDFLTIHDGVDLTEHPEKKGFNAMTITNPAEFRDSLKSKPYIACAFISPSGTGVKAVARIPAQKSTHRGHYAAILRIFPMLDPTSRNESRICFDAYDPGIWVAEEFADFTEYIAPDEPKPAPEGVPATKTDYSKLNRCADMIRAATDGSKHETLLKAAKLAGGFVAGGVVDELVAVRMLESEIEAKGGVLDIKAAFRTIQDGIEYGKRVPIYEQQPEEQPLPKTPSRNGIHYVADVWEEMDHGFHHGKERGKTTHFADLDECFTWKPGEFTVISGRPGSGKSEWILQLMLIKSKLCGWKWGVFSPESYPAAEFYDTLIHTYVGKTTDPAYREYQMSIDEYESAANFIHQHFFYVYPDTAHTIEEVEADFLHLHKEHGLAGVLIDPFNKLRRDFAMRDDQYLESFIPSRQRMARENHLSYLTVCHPKQMPKNKEGEYDIVDAYDLANGAMWINMTDNFISVYRPHQSLNPKDTSVEIHVKKIKRHKLVGVPGSVFWDFKRQANRYYSNGESPFEESKRSNQFPVVSPVEINF